MSGAPCEFLEWDSTFFGARIGRIHGDLLTLNLLAEIRAWSVTNEVECLYFFAKPDDYETVRIAEESGFSLVDVRVTYERRLLSSAPRTATDRVRIFEPGDLPLLKEIARSSHKESRFYFDGRFSRSRCDELFELWLERSCSGWADAVLVGLQEDQPTGYITCHQMEKTGKMGLAAVSERVRLHGLGAELVQAALEYFKDQGVERVKTVTQGRNRASQRLFQRSGFLTDRLELTYHWWL